MKPEDIQKMIQEAVSKSVSEQLAKLTDFRLWRSFDSVTDVFSPITGNSKQIGFYGATKVTKQTVTGSRGANAALTSLLTALANLGLIVNSSS